MKSPPPGNLQASTIREVVHCLDSIIEWAKSENSKLGYFPALYRKVTKRIELGILNEEFEDNARMERFDVNFANRYFEAFEQYFSNGEPTRAWKLAFDSTERWRPIVLQHLLLGMNAHIYLDLGIAASESIEPENLQNLENDFNKVNGILAELIDSVQKELAQVWPFLRILDWMAGRTDESLADLALGFFRGHAWEVANEMSSLSSEESTEAIRSLDQRTIDLGGHILFRGSLMASIFLMIRITEIRSVRKIIEILE